MNSFADDIWVLSSMFFDSKDSGSFFDSFKIDLNSDLSKFEETIEVRSFRVVWFKFESEFWGRDTYFEAFNFAGLEEGNFFKIETRESSF